MAVADWVWLRTGVDPAGEWREGYHDRQSRAALLRRERAGFRELLRRGFEGRARLNPTSDPRLGDVGFVRIVLGTKRCGGTAAIALDDGSWWTPATAGGSIILMPRSVIVMAAWRIP